MTKQEELSEFDIQLNRIENTRSVIWGTLCGLEKKINRIGHSYIEPVKPEGGIPQVSKFTDENSLMYRLIQINSDLLIAEEKLSELLAKIETVI